MQKETQSDQTFDTYINQNQQIKIPVLDTLNKSKPTHKLKYLIVIFSNFTLMGAYFLFDSPIGIHDQVRDRFKDHLNTNNDTFELYYSILYGCFAWPNIILPFLMGFLADKIGCRKVLFSLTLCLFIGSILFYLGYSQYSFTLMIIGRSIIGICIGSIYSMLSYFLSQYFLGGYLSVILSILLGLGNLFDSINISTSPFIIEQYSTEKLLILNIIIALLSFLSCIILIILDRQIENQIKKNQLFEQNIPTLTLIDLFKQIKQLPKIYWLCFSYTVLSLWSILPFFGNSANIFSENYYKNDPNKSQKSAFIASLLWFLALPLGCFMGYILDRYGHRSKFSILAGILSTIANFLVFNVHPLIPICLMSLSYSIFMTTYWSQISYIVPEVLVGRAYGLVMTGKFTGLAGISALIGVMRSSTGTYMYSQELLSFIGFMTCFISTYIYYFDKKKLFGLEKPKVKQ